MRTEFRWYMMRMAVLLAQAVPCSFTERLRSEQVSRCMRNSWR